MSKIYLGCSFGFNSSAALLHSERGLLKAISQERVINVKNTKEIPIDAMVKCCKDANVSYVDYLCISHYQQLSVQELYKYVGDKYKYFLVKNDIQGLSESSIIGRFFYDALLSEGITLRDRNYYRVVHHFAHACSCIPFYGFDEDSIFVTADGFGDGVSQSTLQLKFERDVLGNLSIENQVLSSSKLVNSIALIYQFVTGALGFKEHQHEGKITGLAAHGYPSFTELFEQKLLIKDTYLWFVDESKLLSLSNEEKRLVNGSKIIDFDKFLRLKKTVYDLVFNLLNDGASKKDLAASVQYLTEKYILRSIRFDVDYRRKRLGMFSKPKCYLAGGLFANVKLNQKIRESGLFDEVCVAPPMGDEGTSIGAIVSVLMRNEPQKFYDLFATSEVSEMPYLGTNISCSLYEAISMRRGCLDVDIDYFEYEDDDVLIDKIVDALANKKIVCLCVGEMEFGPRALCHRTILYDCTNKSTNDWLNKQLGRTEFMPFAPVCLDKNAPSLFSKYDDVSRQRASKYMTMTYHCNEEFVNNYPAACHIDDTARPQVISKNDNEFMYKVLDKYESKTGLKVLINTSFNLHNFPIVEDRQVAFDSWYKSNTDVLVLGKTMFKRVRDKKEN